MIGDQANDYQLQPGRLDDIIVFWRCGRERRAVFTWDYTKTSDYAAYLLERRFGIAASALASRVGELRAGGNVLAFHQAPHMVGIMRPWVLGDAEAVRSAEIPFLVAYDRDATTGPVIPVVSGTRDDAAGLVRLMKAQKGLDTHGWRRFECEPLLSPVQKLIGDLARRRSNWPTELERLIGVTERRLTHVRAA